MLNWYNFATSSIFIKQYIIQCIFCHLFYWVLKGAFVKCLAKVEVSLCPPELLNCSVNQKNEIGIVTKAHS